MEFKQLENADGYFTYNIRFIKGGCGVNVLVECTSNWTPGNIDLIAQKIAEKWKQLSALKDGRMG